MHIRKVTVDKATLKRLDLIREGERLLLEYRPDGYEVTPDDYRAICDAINAGMSPAEAAEIVNATTRPTPARRTIDHKP